MRDGFLTETNGITKVSFVMYKATGIAEYHEEAPGSLATFIEHLSDPGNVANYHIE